MQTKDDIHETRSRSHFGIKLNLAFATQILPDLSSFKDEDVDGHFDDICSEVVEQEPVRLLVPQFIRIFNIVQLLWVGIVKNDNPS